MSKHTPGPWNATLFGKLEEGRTKVLANSNQRNKWVCTTFGNSNSDIEECEANALLIAAAPKMLEALYEFLKVINRSPAALHHYSEAIKMGEEAIAKATGGNQ